MWVLPRSLAEVARASNAARFKATVFAATLLYSIAVQFIGANGEPVSAWSAVPVSVDFHLERVWMLTDNQIERDALSAYHRWSPNQTLNGAYAAAFRGVVLSVRAVKAVNEGDGFTTPAGASFDATAVVQNVGLFQWFGFRSGYSTGQVRVRVSILDASQREISESFLYIGDSPNPGERATALGTLTAPGDPGKYSVFFNVIADRSAVTPGGNFSLPLTVQ